MPTREDHRVRQAFQDEESVLTAKGIRELKIFVGLFFGCCLSVLMKEIEVCYKLGNPQEAKAKADNQDFQCFQPADAELCVLYGRNKNRIFHFMHSC